MRCKNCKDDCKSEIVKFKRVWLHAGKYQITSIPYVRDANYLEAYNSCRCGCKNPQPKK